MLRQRGEGKLKWNRVAIPLWVLALGVGLGSTIRGSVYLK